jgi:hypothetical protein
MPKIRRQNLPRGLYAHLLDRVEQRSITAHQLRLLLRWIDTQPEVPNGRWFKRFPELVVCGEGELIKTFLLPSHTPTGEEVAGWTGGDKAHPSMCYDVHRESEFAKNDSHIVGKSTGRVSHYFGHKTNNPPVGLLLLSCLHTQTGFFRRACK